MSSDAPLRALPEVGAVVAGYRLEGVLEHSGIGVMYRAQHLALERPATVRIIAPLAAGSAEFRERFRRESQTAASLEHPNIVPIFDAGDTDGLLYIATRLIAGTDLAAYIAAHGALPTAQAVQISAQVASALDAAHTAGLVHGDVKPANVLLLDGNQNHAYLTGFGATTGSDTLRDLADAAQTTGTVDFTSPEQLRGESVDRRADIYSLGALLYQALTGRVPYPRDNDLATMQTHINESPPVVSQWAPGVPAQLDAVIAGALAKDPEQRPATAGEFAAAARAAVEGRDVDLSKVAADTDPGLSAPAPVHAARSSRAWMLPACGIAAVLLWVIGELLRPPGEPAGDATTRAVKAWAQVHQTGLIVHAGVFVVAALAFLGMLAAVAQVIRDADCRLSSRGLATLAVGVSFVMLALADQASSIALARESGSHDLSLIKFLWYADGYLQPALSSLFGFFIAGVAAETRSHGTLPDAVTTSGLWIGLFAGVTNLVFLVLPINAGPIFAGLLLLVFVVSFGWALVVSVLLTARARASGSLAGEARP